MIVYRLSKGKFKNDLSGTGAKLSGGRWNSKGVALLYTGASRALCTAELAVHLPLGNIPADYWMVAIEIPDDAIQELDLAILPAGWNDFPHSHATQQIGDDFVKEGKALILKVPSAVVSGDFNYIINPGHANMKNVRIVDTVPYTFDNRLFIR